MAVEKAQFAIPMAAGSDGFPFTLFQAEKEAALIVEAGCGSKRKAEEESEELPAAVAVQWNGEEDEFYKAYMSDDSIGYDSDEGPNVCYAKCKAFVERRIEASNARHPWLMGKVADGDGARVV